MAISVDVSKRETEQKENEMGYLINSKKWRSMGAPWMIGSFICGLIAWKLRVPTNLIAGYLVSMGLVIAGHMIAYGLSDAFSKK